MRERRVFRVALIIGVVLGVMGISDATSSNPSKAADGANLRRASTILFLVLTLIQAVQTLLVFTQSGTRRA
jgi:magnesium-transporting ATPase (P-type)